jgi:hypothetical protein
MSPNETLFLESTNKIIKEDISNSSFVRFAIWDFPGQVSLLDGSLIFENSNNTLGASFPGGFL